MLRDQGHAWQGSTSKAWQGSTSSALLQFTDDILGNMENGQVTGVVYLDLKKAFDTVNHRILILKLRAMGADDSSIRRFKSYLNNRNMRTVVGNAMSSSRTVNIGVPQGSVLGPLFFLIYINDLAEGLQNSKAALFADDTAIYCSATSAADLQLHLNEDLKIVSKWMDVSKTKLKVIGGKQRLSRLNSIELTIKEELIDQVDKFKYLGIIINESLDWSDHIDYVQSKVAKRLGLLKRLKHLLPRQSRELVYKTVIQPVLEYGDIVWGDRFNNTLMERLQVLQNEAAKVILDRPLYSSASDALQALGWKSLSERRRFHRSCMVFKSFNALIDFNFNQIRRSDLHHHNTRSGSDLIIPVYRTNWGQSRSDFLFIDEFNKLPKTLTMSRFI